MKQLKIANKFAIISAGALCVFGAVIAVLQLINSLKYGFDLYRFGPAVLFILSFALLAAYALSVGLKSAQTFQAVMAAYGLVVIVNGLIFPPVYPHGTKIIFMIADVLVVLGLLSFNSFWSNVKLSKVFLTVAWAVELTAAFMALNGNPMALEDDFVARAALFIRPIIISTIAVCYLARMYQKKKEVEAQSTSAR